MHLIVNRKHSLSMFLPCLCSDLEIAAEKLDLSTLTTG